ncbi:MAG: hydantoinase B/oxoprolinase family protein [Peptococcaceae bacterium]
MSKQVVIDPITAEVLGNALLSAAEEMGGTLVRSSYSTNIKERNDCSAAIFNGRGDTIAQAEHIPVHLGSMLGIVNEIKRKYPLKTIKPGDMFIANDPYSGGGTHLPDITLAAPVFYQGEIIAFVANIAHHSDIGGRVPGSMSGDSTSIFQEGIRLPVVKVMDAGVICQEILDIILLNCRTPVERTGDLLAQMAANKIGLQRVNEVFHKYGKDVVLAGMEELMNYAERKMLAGISSIPEGTYEFADYLDDDGIEIGRTLKINVRVIVEKSRIILDFTGSTSQVKGAINVVKTALQATVYYALKAIIDPTLPANAGYYRPVKIIAPQGTIVNPRPPASVGARTDCCQRIVDVVFGAMAQAVPQKVIAGCNSAMSTVIFAGTDPRNDNFYVYPESLGGGLGARFNKDGMDGVHVHITNTSNLPVECLESEYPLLVERYELRNDSGGAGRYRGGLGFRRDYRILHETTFSSHADRQKIPPWGLFGGKAGTTGRFVINPGTPKEVVLKTGKVSEVILKAGDVLSAQTPGSGGYGDPLRRSTGLVLQDIREEKVSAEMARQLYKVAVNPAQQEIDPAETQRLRDQK